MNILCRYCIHLQAALCCQVLDIGELIAPYISLETKKAIEMAKEEAEVAAMNQLAIEQAKSSGLY